jgi:hypothetical protein
MHNKINHQVPSPSVAIGNGLLLNLLMPVKASSIQPIVKTSHFSKIIQQKKDK